MAWTSFGVSNVCEALKTQKNPRHAPCPQKSNRTAVGLTRRSIHFEMTYWVYILASKPGGTLYVSVTNNLIRRIYEHREGLAESFTKRYGVKMLVYFEAHDTIEGALQREKNIKH